MASVEKFSFSAVSNQLRHIERTIENPKNKDIDVSRHDLNYSLLPDRGMSSYTYFKKRLADPDVYVYKKQDMKPMCGWIITAPDDVPTEKEDLFFRQCFNFLNERYGSENCIQAVVHKDESGKSHMHYCFVPIAERTKMSANHKERYKVSARDVITRRELRDFHPMLDKYLREHGLPCSVYTGVTARQGGNRTVKEMKAERAERTRQIERNATTITW